VGRRLQWETGVLEKRLEKRVRILKALPRRRLRERLRSALCSVAGCAEDSPDPVIIHGVLNQAAKTLSLDPARYLDAASLEQAVFEKGVERKLHQMQESLRRMSPRDLDACEKRLERDLDNLGSADRESLRSLLGLEKLSGPALIGFFAPPPRWRWRSSSWDPWDSRRGSSSARPSRPSAFCSA
jgi:hypothetical protein